MPGSKHRWLSLLQLSSLRFMSRHPWQTWLTFIGVMLGVSMIVAVDLANSSARRAFALSLDTVAGKVTHQIVGGPNGIPESLYTRIRTELGIRTSAPMVMGRVYIAKRQFTLLGIDPFAEELLGRHVLAVGDRALVGQLLGDHAVMLSKRAAESLGLHVNQEFSLEVSGASHPVILSAVFPASNPAASEGLVFADISVAQELFKQVGKLDRIELILNKDQVALLRSWLPRSLSLEQSKVRNSSLEEMTEAFHINLTAMSLLAMLVAALLIYNTVTLSVLQRRNTLGTYRSLGVSTGEIFRLVLGESMALALLASVAGVLVGILLGHFLVQLVTRTIDDLYFTLHVKAFLLDPFSLLRGFAIGMGMSFVSALLPALEATRSQPVSLQQRSLLEQRWLVYIPRLFMAGAGLMLAGFLLLNRPLGTLVEGFVSLTLIVFGFCLMVPVLVVIFTRVLAWLMKPVGVISLRMAVRGISAGISRTGMAVAALTIAVSVTVGVGVMVSSFRDTVRIWLEESLVGDVYIADLDNYPLQQQASLHEQLLQLPEVSALLERKFGNVETQFGPVRLMAYPSSPGDTGLLVKQAVDNAAALFYRGEGIFISEPLAYRTRLTPGDSMQIRTGQGLQHFPVLGVYYNYATSRGVISMQRSQYARLWADQGVSSLAVSRSTGVSQERLISRVREVVGQFDGNAVISSNREILEEAMRVFDRTFVITRVLRLLAVLVAFVGVLSALMALQLERIKEYAILRATGMTPGQVGTMIIAQTGIIGLISGILSLPMGLMMADILIDVINRRAFGWSMQTFVPGEVLGEALLLAVLAAVVAGLYPALKAAAISPAVALREE